MKKITITLLSFIFLLVPDCLAQIDSIWFVTSSNIHNNFGCNDTMWFRMFNPIPTLENERGKVVEITTHSEDKNADIYNPQNLMPHEGDIWLSDDRYTIFVIIKNIKQFVPGLRSGTGNFNGPFYGIRITDRFTKKKDNSPDEILFKNYRMGFNLTTILKQAGVEEGSRMMLKEKIGDYWYAPFYVRPIRNTEDLIEEPLSNDVYFATAETKYSVYTDEFFGDRKFLRWETIEARPGKVGYLQSSKTDNTLEYIMHCEAVTAGVNLTLTPVYSKPIPRWKLTITMDSTMKELMGTHYYPWQQWDTVRGENRVVCTKDTPLQLSLLKDSSDYVYAPIVIALPEQFGLPIRMISNVPEFNIVGNGYQYLKPQIFYYHPGYDSVHIHITRSAVNSVEENVPEAGLQQLQWQTTSERDILLKTPPLWGEGQVELYTIVGTMVQQFDVNTLNRSSEGMLLPTAGIPSGAYIVLVKSKNYRSGTVLQIIR
ncbi:MAG: hypothetical protein JST20_01795, partial [Bacteroidetes bacterium]|nr:hypothetical protein [Bacteroidota bacterium]